jgi:hypothetical protein
VRWWHGSEIDAEQQALAIVAEAGPELTGKKYRWILGQERFDKWFSSKLPTCRRGHFTLAETPVKLARPIGFKGCNFGFPLPLLRQFAAARRLRTHGEQELALQRQVGP